MKYYSTVLPNSCMGHSSLLLFGVPMVQMELQEQWLCDEKRLHWRVYLFNEPATASLIVLCLLTIISQQNKHKNMEWIRGDMNSY